MKDLNKGFCIVIILALIVFITKLLITNYTIENKKLVSFSNIPVNFGSDEELENYKKVKVVDIKDFSFEDDKIYEVGVFMESPDEKNNPMFFNFENNGLKNVNLGHAFMILIMSDKNDKGNIVMTSVGLYPEKNLTLKDVVSPKSIRGVIKNNTHHNYTNFKIIKTHAENFKKLLDVINSRNVALEEGKLKYNLKKYNSVTFIKDVLDVSGEIDFVIKKTGWELSDNEVKRLGPYKTVAHIINFKSRIIRSYNVGITAETIENNSFNEKLGDGIKKFFKEME